MKYVRVASFVFDFPLNNFSRDFRYWFLVHVNTFSLLEVILESKFEMTQIIDEQP